MEDRHLSGATHLAVARRQNSRTGILGDYGLFSLLRKFSFPKLNFKGGDSLEKIMEINNRNPIYFARDRNLPYTQYVTKGKCRCTKGIAPRVRASGSCPYGQRRLYRQVH